MIRHPLSPEKKLLLQAASVLAVGAVGFVAVSKLLDHPKFEAIEPEAVKAQEPSVVKILNPGASKFGLIGSGVKIGENQVLTAGHLLRNSVGSLPDAGFKCGDIWVEDASSGPRTAQKARKAVSRYTFRADKDKPEPGGIDVSLVQIEDDSSFTGLPSATIVSQAPKPGDHVYFTNYQPYDAKTQRDPSAKKGITPLGEGILEPAKYDGMFVGRLDHGRGEEVVVTGLNTYDKLKPTDNFSKLGSSGGPVFSARGELIGLSNAVTSESVRSVEKEFHVRLPFSPLDQVHLEYIQPIDHQLVADLQQALSTAPNCT